MRHPLIRALVLLALALLPHGAAAQEYFRAAGGSSAVGSTGLFSVQLQGTVGGGCAAPMYSAQGVLTTGLSIAATPSASICVGGTAVTTWTGALAATTVPLGVGISPPLEQVHAFASGTVGIFASWSSDESLVFGGDTASGPYVASHTRTNGNSFGNTAAVRLNFGAGGFVVRTSPATAAGAARTFTTYATVGITGGLTLPRLALGTTSTDGAVLENTTAATGGATVQISPRLRLSGAAWDSDDSVSRTTSSILEVLPVSGATVSSLTRIGVIDPIAGTTTYPMQWTAAQARLLDGTNATPALGFVSETNTGMFLAGGGEIGLATLGTTQMRLGGSYLWAIPAKFLLGSGTRWRMLNAGATNLNFVNDAETIGVGIDFGTDGIMKVRDRAHTGNGSIAVNNALTFSGAAPTISSGFGTSPSVVAGTVTAFTVNVGTGGTASNGVVGLPTATTGWICDVENRTGVLGNYANQRTIQIASTTTSATFENQTISTGAALAWTASDVLAITCTAY